MAGSMTSTWNKYGEISVPDRGEHVIEDMLIRRLRVKDGRVVSREVIQERRQQGKYDDNDDGDGYCMVKRDACKQVFDLPQSRIKASKPEIVWSNVNKQLQWKGSEDNKSIREAKEPIISKRNKYVESEETRTQSSGTTSKGKNAESRSRSVHNFSKKASSFLVFSYSDIKAATRDFSRSAKIGEGGYGSVYKGKLNDNKVAIKILDANSQKGQPDFLEEEELELLSGMKHPNLVNLLGVCFQSRALVYEFVPNGNLEDCLNDDPKFLTWQIRIRIMYEICSSLIFIHSKFMVHGNLKPDNVLLDYDFNSKLGDFGLCHFMPRDTNTYNRSDPKGSYGYIDPDFPETGKPRPSSDVYSFGVTILTLLTGMPAPGISKKVYDAYNNTRSLKKMIDPTAGHWQFEMAQKLAYWGLTCCHDSKKSKLLEEIRTVLEDMLTELEP